MMDEWLHETARSDVKSIGKKPVEKYIIKEEVLGSCLKYNQKILNSNKSTGII